MTVIEKIVMLTYPKRREHAVLAEPTCGSTRAGQETAGEGDLCTREPLLWFPRERMDSLQQAGLRLASLNILVDSRA